jgi:hypothetical protein
MSDQDFFREVNEAVRQDRYRALWDRYGIHALVAAALIVAGVAGYKGWNYWRESQAAEAGAQFTEALSLTDGADASKAKDIFASLVAKGPEGYKTLARFQLAASEAKAGNTDEAVAAYDSLAADSGVDRILQGHAAVQAATLRLDKADTAEMERRLKPLIDSNSAWKDSARALLGLSAYRQNNMREAERQFSTLLSDSGTPPNLRETADMMLALIVGSPQTLSTTAK